MKILFISLGCDKNLADSETMLGLLASRGYQIVDTEEDADVIIVNTCCFIPIPELKIFLCKSMSTLTMIFWIFPMKNLSILQKRDWLEIDATWQ